MQPVKGAFIQIRPLTWDLFLLPVMNRLKRLSRKLTLLIPE